MQKLVFTVFLGLFLSAKAALALPISACERAAGGGNPTAVPSQLGIGVLVESLDGEWALGKAPYTASFHRSIVETLMMDVRVARIVWMGEIRYVSDEDGEISILEANETSQTYLNLMKNGLKDGEREIAVGNSVHAIPAVFRAGNYRPIPYDNNNKHLVPALSKLPLTADIRHSIGNSLAAVGAVIRILLPRDRARAERAMSLARDGIDKHTVLIRHLILNLIEEGQLRARHMADLMKLLTWLEEGRAIDEYLAYPLEAANQQAQSLAELLSRNNAKVEILRRPMVLK